MFTDPPIDAEAAAERAAEQTPGPRENRLSGAARKREAAQRLVLFQKQRRLERRAPPPEQPRVTRGRQGVAREQWQQGYNPDEVAVLDETAEYRPIEERRS